jgi:ATP-dependent Clp protease ATP-binding subunit ClpC
MRCRALEEEAGGGYRLTLAVSGFAALDLLAAEDGWHVLELPRDAHTFDRLQVRVRVAPQPERAHDDDALMAAARTALAADGGPPRVVRRYRREPSPLVRDAVRGWRTGRLDLVLAGDFDLIEG